MHIANKDNHKGVSIKHKFMAKNVWARDSGFQPWGTTA